MNIVAFDLGASGGKLFLAQYQNHNLSVQEIHRFTNCSISIGDSLYWDILQIYKEMNNGIKKAMELTGDNIDSFGVDSFSNDFAFVDSRGAILSQVHCYRDSRTRRCEDAIYHRISKEKLYRCSGNQNALFNTFMQLAAIREEGNGHLIDGAYKLLFIPDLLTFSMTGKMVSEYTISSVSQLYDFTADDWCQDILDTYNIPRKLFAPLVKPGTVIGKTSPEYNQMMGTKGFSVSAVCEHDTASAFLSSPLLPDCALISCGTWCLIGTETPACIISPEGYHENLANEGGPAGHHRLLKNVMGTWLLQETRRYYQEQGTDYSFPQLESLAEQAKPFAFLFDPDDDCFYSPGNMPLKIQKYCMDHYGCQPQTVGEIVRSIYESLALKFRWSVEKLEQATRKTLPVVNMVGGGAKADMLCRFTANATGRKVITGSADASAVGNIAMQLVSTRVFSDIDEAKQLIQSTYVPREYTPDNFQEWDLQYNRFLKLLF